jgi:photosystem II stability/assembly factor-like uncharacterized protein
MKKHPVHLAVGIVFLVLSSHTVNAQWVQTGALSGGNVIALAVNDNQNVYAGTVAGGVFLSTNNGAGWTAVNTGITTTLISSLAVSGNQNVYAGTCGGGIFLSANNDTIWTEVNTGLFDPAVQALAVNGDQNVFAGTYSGVFISSDNGENWTMVNTGLTNTLVTSLALNGNRNIFAGTANGDVFLSTNNGDSWTAVNTGLPPDTYVYSLAVSGGGNVFAGTRGGVFLSTNNGIGWTAVNTGLTDSVVLSFSVSGSNVFAGNYAGVFLSTNNGAGWNAVNTGLTSTRIYSLAVSGNQNVFAGTVDRGVWRRPLSEMVGVIDNKPQRLTAQQIIFRIQSPGHTNTNVAIMFSLPYSDWVNLKIFNLSGLEIATLVNKYPGSGLHSLSFDTRNIAAGCYIVSVRKPLFLWATFEILIETP